MQALRRADIQIEKTRKRQVDGNYFFEVNAIIDAT